MPLNIWNLEWLNHNSQRSYPIADWASKECTESSAIKLPDDFILALSLGINVGHTINIDQFYIKSILVMNTGCSIIIGYEDKDVAITHIRTNTDQVTYTLTGLDEFSDIVGYIAINPKSQIMSGLSGYYNFTRDATCLEADCIRPMIKTISSLKVYTDTYNTGETIYGDVVLKAGANMDIRVFSDDGRTNIVFSAIDGSGLNRDCNCDIDDTMTAIRTINGVHPDANGNINLIGSHCLSVDPGSHSITLEDTCAEPCCGCEELDALYNNLKDCINGATTLKKAVENLVAKQDQLELVYSTEGKGSCNCK